MDTDSISLQASTCYTFGNEPQDNMNHVVIASPNIVDAIHAKLTVGECSSGLVHGQTVCYSCTSRHVLDH